MKWNILSIPGNPFETGFPGAKDDIVKKIV